MSAEPAAADKADAKPKKKGGALKWVLIAVAVLVLAGGGGGGYWYFVLRTQAAGPDEAAAGQEEKKGHAEGGAALKFDPFVVNLADAGGGRYLRVGLSLVIAGDAKEAKELEESKVQLLRIRSAVLELLSQQVSDHVVTAEGKAALKHAIEEQASAVLAPLEVTDVLFTEFVVQF